MINRRQFLRQSGIVVGMFAVFSKLALSASKPTKPEDTIGEYRFDVDRSRDPDFLTYTVTGTCGYDGTYTEIPIKGVSPVPLLTSGKNFLLYKIE